MSDLRQGITPIQHEVLDEIERAIAKFPTWPTDPLHALAVLGEEYGELIKATLQSVYEPHKSNMAHVREEAIQTAAMALRFLASLERYELITCDQHVQDIAERKARQIASATPDPELVDRVAIAMGKADGLDFNECCGFESDAGNCDSLSCIAFHYEDHDPDVARENLRRHALAAIEALSA